MCEWGGVGDEREEGIGGRVVEALGLPPPPVIQQATPGCSLLTSWAVFQRTNHQGGP